MSTENTPDPTKPDSAKELADLRASNQTLMARLEALEKKGNPAPPPPPEDDLALKASKDQKSKDDALAESKKTENALKFSLQSAEWLKTNAALLPKTIEGIFLQAEKEVYGSAIEKASAIKVGIVSEFFSLQSNLDLLTEAQKISLADFKKLTKTDKQDRVQQVYDMVFEPAFESLKRETRAKQVREGDVDPGNAKAAHAKRMSDLSKAKFLKKGAN